jgi:signal peptidase II
MVLIANLLEFRYAENPGMALGFLRDIEPAFRLPLFTGVVLVAFLIIMNLLRQAGETSRRLPVAMGCILAGAFGNLADRYRFDGVVVDFIRVWVWRPARFEWPTFNLADSFITIGIALLIVDMLFGAEATKPAPLPPATDPAGPAPEPGPEVDQP